MMISVAGSRTTLTPRTGTMIRHLKIYWRRFGRGWYVSYRVCFAYTFSPPVRLDVICFVMHVP